jgi:hypothetical protein
MPQTLTITASKANTTKAIEYSRDGGTTWQNSNVFTGVPAGVVASGQCLARLVGTAITSAWNAAVTVSGTADEYAIAATTIAKSSRTGAIKYVLVANSFGEGYPVNTRDITKIFFNLVTTQLKTLYGAGNVTAVNLSVGGRTTQQMLDAGNLAAVTAELDSAPAGAQVVLQWMEGVNELWWGGGDRSSAQGLSDLTAWVNTFKNHAARPVILLATCTPRQSTPFVLPLSANDQGFEDRRRPYNIGVRQNYAASAEAVVDITHTTRFVDAPAAVTTNLWNPDGVHPIEVIHQDIADQTVAAVTPRLNAVAVVAPAYAWKNVTGGTVDEPATVSGLTVSGKSGATFGVTAQLDKAIGVPTTNSTDTTVAWGHVVYKFVALEDGLAGFYEPGKETSKHYEDMLAAGYLNTGGMVRGFQYGNNLGDFGGGVAGYTFKLVAYYDRVEIFLNGASTAALAAVRTEHGSLTPALNLGGHTGSPARVELLEFVALNPIASPY